MTRASEHALGDAPQDVVGRVGLDHSDRVAPRRVDVVSALLESSGFTMVPAAPPPSAPARAPSVPPTNTPTGPATTVPIAAPVAAPTIMPPPVSTDWASRSASSGSSG